MAEPRTDVAAEPARSAATADVSERDRIAWNLPLSAVDEASRRAIRALDAPAPSEKGDGSR